MVAILTRNTLFAAGAFAVVAYMGYKDDIFNSKDSDANKKVFGQPRRRPRSRRRMRSARPRRARSEAVA